MSVRNVVKVMNFHSLLRVNNARKKVAEAHEFESELKKMITSIVNNRIFKEDNISLKMANNNKELNIYIGSDLGFCANFNNDVMDYLRKDADENDKIIIGKRIKLNVKNILLYINKEEFPKEYDNLYKIVLDGVLNRKYSSLNIIYIHYKNLNVQEIMKKQILPINIEQNEIKDDDFAVEGDLFYIIWNLVSLYVTTEIKVAESWSWASENVRRQAFTNESLKKIDERDEINLKKKRKENSKKKFKVIIDATNKKFSNQRKEEQL